MPEPRGSFLRRSPDKKPPDTGVGAIPERGRFRLADRAKALGRLLMLVGVVEAVDMTMDVGPAVAGEHTEQHDGKTEKHSQAETDRTFAQLQEAYQRFDASNLEAVQLTLAVYQAQLELIAAMPPVQRAEVERQYAFLNHRSVALQYVADATQYIRPVDVAKRSSEQHSADTQILQQTLVLLDQAVATRKDVVLLTPQQTQAQQTFDQKVGALRREVQVTMDCINGGAPAAVEAKQRAFDQVVAGLHSAGYTTAKVERIRSWEEGYTTLDITVETSDGTLNFRPFLVYDVTTGAVRYEHRSTDELIVPIENIVIAQLQ